MDGKALSKSISNSRRAWAAAIVLSAVSVPITLGAPTYTYHALTSGSSQSTAAGINNNQAITGQTIDSGTGDSTATVFHVGATIPAQTLPTADSPTATGISAGGIVVGNYLQPGSSQAAFYSDASSGTANLTQHTLATASGTGSVVVNAVAGSTNTFFTAVGQLTADGSSPSVAYQWNYSNGTITSIAIDGRNPLSNPSSIANGVSQLSSFTQPTFGIVGQSSTSAGAQEGFYYGPTIQNPASTFYVLGLKTNPTTGVATVNESYNQASAINGSGEIVGTTAFKIGASTVQHAFSYSDYTGTDAAESGSSPPALDGTYTDLGSLDENTNANSSEALAVNSSGVIVGDSSFGPDVNAGTHAFVSFPGGVMEDLNDLVPLPAGDFYSMATGIDDAGDIVGTEQFVDGTVGAFLLAVNPIPEPASVTAVLIAAGVWGLLRPTRPQKQ